MSLGVIDDVYKGIGNFFMGVKIVFCCFQNNKNYLLPTAADRYLFFQEFTPALLFS